MFPFISFNCSSERFSIEDRTSGYHSAEGRGDDGHLGRTSGGSARQGIGQLDKELRDPGGLQECAEQDKQRDIRGADADGSSDDAAGGIKQVINDGF